jgi:NAD(P)-dependent dehydrogenase (short-subunit alcohol dehydrogenase family)
MSRLAGKRAYITGGTGGIGRATAEAFLAHGAQVWLADLPEEVEAVAREIGAAGSSRVDVTDRDAVRASTSEAAEAMGGLDILFLNAGIEGRVSPIPELEPSLVQQVLDVNLFGVLHGLQAALPHLQQADGASVLITSSVAGLIGSPGMAAYCVSKHAVIGLMRTAALELGALGIRVNTINPGPIDNRMMASIEHMAAPDAESEARAGFTARVPLGRYGRNEEVANLAVFLASDESSYCHGHTYLVDGGFRAG